jgi:hypothetical protein
MNLIANNNSALAGPVNKVEKSTPFRIGVTFHGKETLYLTNTAIASPNAADGIECVITTTTTGGKAVGRIGCGPDDKAFTYSELHSLDPLHPVTPDNKNVGWSIAADDTISWGAMPAGSKSVAFSRAKGANAKSVYAEVCSTYNHHDIFPGFADFWERGVAKAYYAKTN